MSSQLKSIPDMTIIIDFRYPGHFFRTMKAMEFRLYEEEERNGPKMLQEGTTKKDRKGSIPCLLLVSPRKRMTWILH